MRGAGLSVPAGGAARRGVRRRGSAGTEQARTGQAGTGRGRSARARPAPGEYAGKYAGGDAAGSTGALPAEAELTAGHEAPAFPARRYDFNQGWLFGGVYAVGSEQPGYRDGGFTQVTLPHTVTTLSWGNWDHTTWENVWIYRKRFAGGAFAGGRVFADFDGVLTNAAVVLNGVTVATHEGGYLPFSAELTGHVVDGENVLAVIVDARWLNVPPNNPDGDASSVDYLQPGGIYRDVTLRVVPGIYIRDVWAEPVNVLAADRQLQIQVTIDAAAVPSGAFDVTVQLLDGTREIAAAAGTAPVQAVGDNVVNLTMTGLGGVTLWSPGAPKLYTVRTTLSHATAPAHTLDVRTGFRDVTFGVDGFYLNGKRLEIFGLNRHQLFPYLGMAACARLQRRDAEIIKNELQCNMVRCSHYPQSRHFLDACDELGLMVWEEPPGWGYVGDAAFQQVVLQNVRDMVVRDRNRPSVIVWATRLNETSGAAGLYDLTRLWARALDGTRPTTGAMDSYSLLNWAEDVYGYNDYHSAGRRRDPAAAAAGCPVAGQRGGRRAGRRAAATGGPTPATCWPSRGGCTPRCTTSPSPIPGTPGLLGWCAFDYASLNGGMRIWDNLKTPGVLDTFRVPKPAAAFYRSQVVPGGPSGDPAHVLLGFRSRLPRRRARPGLDHRHQLRPARRLPGRTASVSVTPDVTDFGNLAHPLAFADLTVDGTTARVVRFLPELRIDGWVDGRVVTSVRMSADTARDRLSLVADDASIQADGSDTTRLTFRALDAYGNQRPYGGRRRHPQPGRPRRAGGR